MYRKETHLTALAMGTSWFNSAHQQKGNLQYRMLRKITQSLNLFNLQLEILCCWWEMALFVIMFPGIFERQRNQLQVKTIDKQSNHHCPHHLINLCVWQIHFSVLLSILPFQAGGCLPQKTAKPLRFLFLPKVAQAINQPSAETMKPAPVQRIGSGDPVLVDGQFWLMQVDLLTFGDFEILTFLWLKLTAVDDFFLGRLLSTCGTCVREGVSSLTGTLRLKLFLHQVTGTSWTWNELTSLVICKKYHFFWGGEAISNSHRGDGNPTRGEDCWMACGQQLGSSDGVIGGPGKRKMTEIIRNILHEVCSSHVPSLWRVYLSTFHSCSFLVAEDIGAKNERVADRIFHIESNKRVVSSFQAVKFRHRGGLYDLFSSIWNQVVTHWLENL